MKAKIIADIVIIAGANLLFIWWVASIPLVDTEPTIGQALAVMVAMGSVIAFILWMAYNIIKWVNK